MKTHRFISILLLAVFLSAFIAGGERPLHLEKTQDIGRQTIGDVIQLTNTKNDEHVDAVAYSDKSKHYLVVFTDSDSNNGDVKGRFVDAATGKLTGDVFNIAWTEAGEGNSDVAYDPYNDVFLVVYESDTCGGEPWECKGDIKGRLVEEPNLNGSSLAESPLGPNEFTIASQSTLGRNPADPRVAYNQDDHQYLVVFRSGFGLYSDLQELHGQMLSSHKELPVRLGPDAGFDIYSTVDYYYYPDVAWASGSGNFLVVYVQTDKPNLEDATYSDIFAHWLYDTYQDGATQEIGSYGVAPRYPLSKFCGRPAVAYDPTTDSYTVAFSYDKKGEDWEDVTVYGQRLTAEFAFPKDPGIGEPFPVETDLSMYFAYFRPAISYTGPGDTMHVTYRAFENNPGIENDKTSIYLLALNGSQVGTPTHVYRAKKGEEIFGLAIARSMSGYSIVAWDEWPNPSNNGIYAQRVGTFDMTYLPSIFKDK